MFSTPIRTLGAVIAAASLATGALGAGVANAATPTPDKLPIDGCVSVTDDSAYGAYLCRDNGDIHFRTHGAPAGTQFSATITSSAQITDVREVRSESDDSVQLDGSGHTLQIRFDTYAGVDGVDFRSPDGRYLRVDIQANGAELSPSDVFIGDAKTNPDNMPFSVRLRRLPLDTTNNYKVRADEQRAEVSVDTHADSGSHQYTGTITSSGTLEIVDLVHPEKDDSASVSADGHTLSFNFTTEQGEDGVVAKLSGADNVTLNLSIDGQPATTQQIHLGHDQHPASNPFNLDV